MKRSFLLLLAVLALPATQVLAQADADKRHAQNGAEAQDHHSDPNPSPSDLARGVVVEEVRKNSEAEKAGLREGDVLLHWIRGDARGDIASPFDLDQIEIEQGPRGAVTLEGLRGKKNEKQTWVMGADKWKVMVRPQLVASPLSIYREARKLEKADKTTVASKRWQAAAIQAHTDPRPWLSSWFLLQAAKLWTAKQQWKETDAAYAEAIQQAAESGPAIKAQLLRAWAEIYKQRSEWTNAEKCFQQSIAENQKLGDESLIIAATLSDLGSVAWTQGDLTPAERYYEQALDIRQKLAPGSLAVALSFSNLGNVAWNRGDLAPAEEYHSHALDIRRKLAPGSIAVAASFNNLGNVAWSRGDLAQAEKYYQQDIGITQKIAPGSLDLASSFNNLGLVAFDRGDLAKADSYYQQALNIQQKLAPGSLDVATSAFNLGAGAYERGDLAQAEAYDRQALDIQQKVAPGSLAVATSAVNLGAIAFARGDFSKADAWVQQALEIQQKLAPGSLDLAGTIKHLGDVAAKRNDLAKTEVYYRQALAIYEKLAPGSRDHAELLLLLALILRHNQQPEAAALLYEKALDSLESQTARLGGSEETRSSFRANHENYYRKYVDLLLAQKRPELAFEVLERSRARSLLELLAAGHVDIRQGVDAELLARERSLQGDIAAKSGIRIRLLSEKDSDARVAALSEEILKLKGQYNDVEGQIRSSSPVYAALTQPKPLSAQEVHEQLLDADTMLLEYSLGEERSSVFAVTQNSVLVYELPKRSEIEKVARRLYDALTARNHTVKGEKEEQAEARWARADVVSQQASEELSQMILGPVASLLGRKRLLIVADGVLQYIPFSALSAPEEASAISSTAAIREGAIVSKASTLSAHKAGHKPLALEHEIVNLPSASVLAELRRQETGRQEPTMAVAVLADPVFDPTDERVEHGSQKAGALPGALTRSMADVGVRGAKRSSLHRLLYTRQEANSILSFTPAGKGMKALDFQASRAIAMSASLAQYHIVHFATHGLLDSKHPEFSGLVLSMVDHNGKSQDGFLGLGDIYNLELPVDLVVLSGCETALGEEISGEGLIGLTRGFMYAGASRVVASLWSVDDAATSELMARFYKAMERGGMRPAAALRVAQMEMWKQKAWSSPYYWASFQIQGEWR